ncbi:hypothetical protein UNSW1_1208 [Campylobacter concisus UNSW1]|nr:hypothetical protein UNSW1_1208 [Campylobacter concisus UNSW1]
MLNSKMINFFIFVLENLGDFIEFYLIMIANLSKKERYGS